MKHYVNKNNEVFAHDLDGIELENIIEKQQLTLITEEEANLINNPLLVLINGKYVDNIELLKFNKKAEITTKKEQAEFSNIEYMNTTIQADVDSQFKLLSAISLCQIAKLKNYDWWDLNNKKVTMTIDELVGLGALLASRSSELVAKGRLLKDKLEKCKTLAEIEKIQW